MPYLNAPGAKGVTPNRIDPRRDFDTLSDSVQLTLAEAAAVLGVSPNTVKIPDWRVRNGLDITKLGKSVRISCGAIRALLAKSRRRAS